MSTLTLDRRPRPPRAGDAPTPPEQTAPEHGSDGFVDCRGVFHAWDEEED